VPPVSILKPGIHTLLTGVELRYLDNSRLTNLLFGVNEKTYESRRPYRFGLCIRTGCVSGIGSLVLAGKAHYPLGAHILGFVAVTTATINVVGGFGITDRMLKMFGKRKTEPAAKGVAK
jgi:hypothetical protein